MALRVASMNAFKKGLRVRAREAHCQDGGEVCSIGDEGVLSSEPLGGSKVVGVAFNDGPEVKLDGESALAILEILPVKGLRVRARTSHVEGDIEWYAVGDEGITCAEPGASASCVVKLETGKTRAFSGAQIKKVGGGDVVKGDQVECICELSDGKGGALCTLGQKGRILSVGQKVDCIHVIFDRWKDDPTPAIRMKTDQGQSHLEVIGLTSGTACDDAAAQPPGPSSPAAAAAPLKVQRKRNRWGDGLDAPAAGARGFFPDGWIPTQDVYESIKVFGHSEEALAKIRETGEGFERELAQIGITTTADHAAAIFSYTEEEKTDLYGKLNMACRTAGVLWEKRLGLYRNYLHHLTEAVSSLQNFSGKVYRGIEVKINPETYAVGKTVTWQAFSSSSKKQQIAKRFLLESCGRLTGSIFIITVKTGKEIEAFSAIPEEEEVIFKLNTHFKVRGREDEEAAKKAALVDLTAYDLRNVDVYLLDQL